jgi:hypothetical protein
LIYKLWCSKIEEDRPAFYKIKLPVFHENCPILEVLVKKKTQVEPEGLWWLQCFLKTHTRDQMKTTVFGSLTPSTGRETSIFFQQIFLKFFLGKSYFDNIN